MEITLPTSNRLQTLVATLFGCALLSLCAHLKIPFYPVPFTMQTFAIFVIGLTQTPKQALFSTLTYLLLASLGLPLLAGPANPLWYTGKTAGYLLSFPIAAYLVAKIAQKHSPLLAVTTGQFLIFLIGFCGLVPFVGPRLALTHGVLLFIGPCLLKNISAIYLCKHWNHND